MTLIRFLTLDSEFHLMTARYDMHARLHVVMSRHFDYNQLSSYGETDTI